MSNVNISIQTTKIIKTKSINNNMHTVVVPPCSHSFNSLFIINLSVSIFMHYFTILLFDAFSIIRIKNIFSQTEKQTADFKCSWSLQLCFIYTTVIHTNYEITSKAV